MWLRSELKRALLSTFSQVLNTDEGRHLIVNSLDGLLDWRPSMRIDRRSAVRPPYPELGREAPQRQAGHGEPIIITARFRTGSTLLWNIFRHVDGVTAYYEPFNRRRWFDPASHASRIDPTHRHVTEYWSEYDGLSELGTSFRESWAVRQLWMDAHGWDPSMRRYLQTLLDRAPGRPVLQFNQIDFRLGWLRRHFPKVKLVHLYRHPRDQWCSSLIDPTRFGKSDSVAEFREHDYFYLLPWARDLKYHFPFLDERQVSHPYELFYYIWKLSFLCGVQYADHSLAFETLTQEPRAELARLFSAVALDRCEADIEKLLPLVDAAPPPKWRAYADDQWFRWHESRCETVLVDFLAGQAAPC